MIVSFAVFSTVESTRCASSYTVVVTLPFSFQNGVSQLHSTRVLQTMSFYPLLYLRNLFYLSQAHDFVGGLLDIIAQIDYLTVIQKKAAKHYRVLAALKCTGHELAQFSSHKRPSIVATDSNDDKHQYNKQLLHLFIIDSLVDQPPDNTATDSPDHHQNQPEPFKLRHGFCKQRCRNTCNLRN